MPWCQLALKAGETTERTTAVRPILPETGRLQVAEVTGTSSSARSPKPAGQHLLANDLDLVPRLTTDSGGVRFHDGLPSS